jgi:hypothetical protein
LKESIFVRISRPDRSAFWKTLFSTFTSFLIISEMEFLKYKSFGRGCNSAKRLLKFYFAKHNTRFLRKVSFERKFLAVQRWQRQGVTRCYLTFFWRRNRKSSKFRHFYHFFHFFRTFFLNWNFFDTFVILRSRRRLPCIRCQAIPVLWSPRNRFTFWWIFLVIWFQVISVNSFGWEKKKDWNEWKHTILS